MPPRAQVHASPQDCTPLPMCVCARVLLFPLGLLYVPWRLIYAPWSSFMFHGLKWVPFQECAPPLCVRAPLICTCPRALLCPPGLKCAPSFRCARLLHLCTLPGSRACPPLESCVAPSLPGRTCLPLAVYAPPFRAPPFHPCASHVQPPAPPH
jgi:hypothetical protein